MCKVRIGTIRGLSKYLVHTLLPVCGTWMLGTKHGFVQSMDCVAQSKDPRFVQSSMGCTVRKAQSSDLRKIWISLTKAWL